MLLLVRFLAEVRYDVVSKRVQFPAGGNFRVQLADGTGGDIPRIGVSFPSFFLLFFVNSVKFFFS